MLGVPWKRHGRRETVGDRTYAGSTAEAARMLGDRGSSTDAGSTVEERPFQGRVEVHAQNAL